MGGRGRGAPGGYGGYGEGSLIAGGGALGHAKVPGRRGDRAHHAVEARDGCCPLPKWIIEEAQGTDAYVIGQPTRFEMTPVGRNTLRVGSESTGPVWTFLDPDEQGRFRLAYASGRLSRRIPER